MDNDNLYCSTCGTKLVMKSLEHEGEIPFCPHCEKFSFPHFSTAVSMIVICKDETLLIKQYGRDRFILVAGYITKGENAEEACARELFEETGLKAQKITILKTSYFSKTNVLMVNCLVEVDSKDVVANFEIDSYAWFSFAEGKEKIASGSLAEQFYLNFYHNYI